MGLDLNMADLEFRIEVPGQDGITVLKLVGCVAPSERGVLSEKLTEILGKRKHRRLLMDMSGVEFLSPSELGVLMYFQREFAAQGKCLVFTSPSWQVKRLLRASKFERALTIRSCLEDGIALLKAERMPPAANS
jgi:anti-anti-sigma factor